MGNIDLRVSASGSYGGTVTAISLGGYISTSSVSTAAAGFWDNITQAQNDAGLTEYRCVFVVNNGTTVMNNVTLSVTNSGGGATVTAALCNIATTSASAYVTQVLASETTAPTQVSGAWLSTVSIGTLNAGQARAVWLKRVLTAKTAATSSDRADLIVSAAEVIPAP